MRERLEREGSAQTLMETALAVERGEHVVIAGRRRHDRDVRVVLGGRPDHRRSADVDLLDELVDRDPGALQRLRERVEVADDDLERCDPRGEQLASVVGQPAVGEDPGMDPRVERLDPPIEHLGRPGDCGHIGHRQAGVAQRPGRATRRDQLEPASDEAATELDDAGLVVHRQQCPARDGDARVRAVEIHGHRAAFRREGVGEQQRDRTRQESMLGCADPVMERGDIVAGQDHDGLLGDDRAAVEAVVHEMDRAPGDRHAVGECVRNGMRTRKGGQQRRVRVEDPTGERGEDRGSHDPHVAGQDHRVRADGLERGGQRRVVAAWDERGLDPLLGRPVERRAGTVGEDEDDPAAQLSAVRRGGQRPQVRARARDADGDPAWRLRLAGMGHAWPSRVAST